MLHAVSYHSSHRDRWDSFVDASRNGTFLFKRAYMEYHADRFSDASVIVIDDKSLVVALMPACRTEDVVTSHRGLTYGGLIIDGTMTLPLMLQTMEAVLAHLRAAGVSTLVYRPVPAPYHRAPCGEDLVALYLLGATLVRRSALAIVDMRAPLALQERRRRGVKRAVGASVQIKLTTELEAYWELLSTVLRETHHASPVHTYEEIRHLQASFPEHIQLHGAFKDDRMIAGVLIYESEQVARAQYIAAGPDGKDLSALDLLFHTLLTETFVAKRYFDFGTSERGDSRTLHRGLLEQKEGFGARVVVQDQYELDLTQWQSGRLLEALT